MPDVKHILCNCCVKGGRPARSMKEMWGGSFGTDIEIYIRCRKPICDGCERAIMKAMVEAAQWTYEDILKGALI